MSQEVEVYTPQALDLNETFGEYTPHEVSQNMSEKPERFALPDGRYLAQIGSLYLINSERKIIQAGVSPISTGIFYQGITIGYKVLVTKKHIEQWRSMGLEERHLEWLLEGVKKSGWYELREFDLEFSMRGERTDENSGRTYKASLFTRRLEAGMEVLGKKFVSANETPYEVMTHPKGLNKVPVTKYVRETVAQKEAYLNLPQYSHLTDTGDLPVDKQWKKASSNGQDVMVDLNKGPISDIVIDGLSTVGLFVTLNVAMQPKKGNDNDGKWNKSFKVGDVYGASDADYLMLASMGVAIPESVATHVGIKDAPIFNPYALTASTAQAKAEMPALPDKSKGESIKPPADYEPTTDEERKAFGAETKEAFAEYLIDGKTPDLVGLCKTLFNKSPKQISKDELKQFKHYTNLLLTFMKESVTHDTFANKSELVKAVLIPTDGLTDSDPEAMGESFIYTTGLSHNELSLAGTYIVHINNGDMSWDDFQGGF